jgi:uncharacterized membrane protein
MGPKILAIWERIRSSLWFVPSLMTLGAIVLSYVAVQVDKSVEFEVVKVIGWIYAGGAEGARGVLATIAGSMMTVAGVAFSITIVALSLASTQFGPRLLRNFMRDTGNQIVLGTFIATYIYCLLVIRTIRVGDDGFVPYISVTLGIVLALASLGVLIYFIHHVSSSIRAENVAATVGREFLEAIDAIFPRERDDERLDMDYIEGMIPEDFDRASVPVAAESNGYIQAIDLGMIARVAIDADLLVRIGTRPGRFVIDGAELISVWPGTRVDATVRRRLNEAFVIGDQRTLVQDIEFAVDQLVEIAVRALSPGINDPFTAITCIDWLGAALSKLLRRPLPSPYLFDGRGRLRVIAHVETFESIADAAFNPIRQYGRGSVPVMVRLLETIADIAQGATAEPERRVLRRHALMIRNSACESTAEESDRVDLERRYRRAVELLATEPEPLPDPSHADDQARMSAIFSKE